MVQTAAPIRHRHGEGARHERGRAPQRIKGILLVFRCAEIVIALECLTFASEIYVIKTSTISCLII